jgi:hypothetical protein
VGGTSLYSKKKAEPRTRNEPRTEHKIKNQKKYRKKILKYLIANFKQENAESNEKSHYITGTE